MHCFTATNPQEKLAFVIDTAQKLFKEGKKTLILAPIEALPFLDQLLWTKPDDSFLPHIIASSPCSDFLCLTHLHINLNQAHALINLTSDVPKNKDDFQEIYELIDETSPEKSALSRLKMEGYPTSKN